MIKFSLGNKKNTRLEEIIARLESNMANNYKDAAQSDYKELEKMYEDLLQNGQLSEKQKTKYGSLLDNYKEKLKSYSHKDQKPYWTK